MALLVIFSLLTLFFGADQASLDAESTDHDWHLRLIGSVTSAVTSQKILKGATVVLTSENVVAALSPTGTLRWRHVLGASTSAAICSLFLVEGAGGPGRVGVIQASGLVYYLHAATGVIQGNDVVSMTSPAANVEAEEWTMVGCVVLKRRFLRCVLHTTTSLGVVEQEAMSTVIEEEEEGETATEHVFSVTPSSDPISTVHFDPRDGSAWVLTKSNAVFYVNTASTLPPTVHSLSARGFLLGFHRQRAILQINAPPLSVVIVEATEGLAVVRTSDKQTSFLGAAAREDVQLLNDGSTVLLDCDQLCVLQMRLFETNETVALPISFPASYYYTAGQVTLIHACTTGTTLSILIRGATGDLLMFKSDLKAASPRPMSLQWIRHEGLSASVDVRIDNVASMRTPTRPSEVNTLDAKDVVGDTFGFVRNLWVLNDKGMVYRGSTANSNWTPFGSVAAAALEVFHTRALHAVHFYALTLLSDGGVAVMANDRTSSRVARLTLSNTSAATLLWVAEDYLFAFAGQHVSSALRFTERISTSALLPTHTWRVDVATNSMRGYRVVKEDLTLSPVWRVGFGSHPISYVATLGRDGQHEASDSLRFVPNEATKTNDVRRRYPTAHLVVVAQYVSRKESTDLTLSVVDTVTGSVLAYQRLPAVVNGSSKVIISENVVLCHFVSRTHGRPLLMVWELFERDDAVPTEAAVVTPAGITTSLMQWFRPQRAFSSSFSRPPVVLTSLLAPSSGEVAAIGVTSSLSGAARKLVVFATARGHVHTADLRSFMLGFAGMSPEIPLHSASERGNAPRLIGVVPLPSTAIVSHGHYVLKPRVVTTSPTKLESTCHVLISGLDIFYTRVTSGKAFDMLNKDFSRSILVVVVILSFVGAVMVRFFARRRALFSSWS